MKPAIGAGAQPRDQALPRATEGGEAVRSQKDDDPGDQYQHVRGVPE